MAWHTIKSNQSKSEILLEERKRGLKDSILTIYFKKSALEIWNFHLDSNRNMKNTSSYTKKPCGHLTEEHLTERHSPNGHLAEWSNKRI